jgi:hypothetical protein
VSGLNASVTVGLGIMLISLRSCADNPDPKDAAIDAREIPENDVPDVTEVPPYAEGRIPEPLRCAYCKETRTPRITCRNCGAVSYCSLNCSQQHQTQHKFHCRLGRPIDEADTFVQFCHRKCFPEKDGDVATAFGFQHFTHAAEQLRLFDIYCKLVNFGKVDDEELRGAWKSNRLMEFIRFRGSQLPLEVIGGDLEWFCSHKDFVAGSMKGVSGFWRSMPELLASDGLDGVNPRQKELAAVFYCQIRKGYGPDADKDNWLLLGFCTAQSSSHFTRIGHLYQYLTSCCTFAEFCQAMDMSKMAELFDKYGLCKQTQELRNFRLHLKSVRRWHESVWELKRFTISNSNLPVRAAALDYGFINCHDGAGQRLLLRGYYSAYFAKGLDEMALHQACVEGNLAPFLASVLGEPPFPQSVLLNSYPLAGCDHMGLVADVAILCTKSNYAMICEMMRAEGNDSVVWTTPDEEDDRMQSFMEDRAAHTSGSMTVKRTMFQGKVVKSMSSR